MEDIGKTLSALFRMKTDAPIGSESGWTLRSAARSALRKEKLYLDIQLNEVFISLFNKG